METVITVNSLSDADRVRIVLQSHGIECFLPDEHTVQGGGHYALSATTGVRIQVPETDLENAREIIQRELYESDDHKPCCPQCGSKRYKKNGLIHTGKQNHRCKRCDRQFVLESVHSLKR